MKGKEKYIVYGILLLYAILLISLQFKTLGFNSLPSPIYGGDYYYQAGSIEHIMNGGNPFSGSVIVDGIAGYLPFYAMLLAPIGLMFGAFKAMFIGSIIFGVLSLFVHFKLFSRLTKNDNLSLLLTSIIFVPSLILKYTELSLSVLLPLFLWFLYDLYEKNNWKNAVKLGLVWGIIAISNTMLFIASSVLLLIFFIDYLIKKGVKSNFYNYIISGVIAFAFAIFIWAKPLFVHFLKPTYERTHMELPDFEVFSVGFDFAKTFFKDLLFNFSSIKTIVVSLLVILGVVVLYMRFSKKEFKFHKILIATMIVFILSYFVTELFGFNLFPTFQRRFLFPYIQILFVIIGFDLIKDKVKHWDKAALVLGVVLLLVGLFHFNNYMSDNTWVQGSVNEIPPHYKDLSVYLKDNTSVNDVILSTKEISFAVNAISGRKALTVRWAQNNDPYTKFYQRDLDQGVILYGNNSAVRTELIEQYDIDYVYWDYYWIQSEYSFDDKGTMVGWYDPLLAYDTMEARNYLTANNVSFFNHRFWVDPSARRDEVRMFDLIYVSPSNFRGSYPVWDEDLSSRLTEVWNYSMQGQVIARLFKVER